MFGYKDEKIKFHHSIDFHPLSKTSFNNETHAHKLHEIFYFISGKAKYLVEGRVYSLKPGSIMIMRAGEFHKVIIEDDTPYERMALHFDGDVLGDDSNKEYLLAPFTEKNLGEGNYFSPSAISVSHIYECLKSIDSVSKDVEERKFGIISNLFPILFEIRKSFDKKVNLLNEGKNEKTLVEIIIDFINANLFLELSLDSLCEKFFISKNHLNRIFKAATGATVWEYIKLKRLIFARNLLLSGVSAIEACSSSGFNDYSAFYRAYKSKFGCSPREDEVKLQ